MRQTTVAHHALDQFRQELYHRALGQRKDTRFELMEAAVVSSSPATLVRLSLAPLFRRRWPSAPDALAAGTLDLAACRQVLHATRAAQPLAARPLWAVDGTVWPRPAAVTSPERTYGHWTSPGLPQAGIIAAWEYQWLVAIPEAGGRWGLPLDVTRRSPCAGSPTASAVHQLRTALAHRPADAPRPVVTGDSGYDLVALAQAGLACDLLVRLPTRQRFYRPPPPYRGRGRRPRHGPVCKLFDPTTHGTPAQTATAEDADHGTAPGAVWANLHDQAAHRVPLALIRMQIERLPKSGKTPKPLWLAWHGGPLPAALLALWRWYRRRFTVEHGFRFLKQDLGWTTVRPRDPAAADRWSWLLALALWQRWLARALVADQRLPWEQPLPAAHRTPGRVRRSFGSVVAAGSSPARPVRPRGNAPGRRPGERPPPHPRYPVVKRRPKHVA